MFGRIHRIFNREEATPLSGTTVTATTKIVPPNGTVANPGIEFEAGYGFVWSAVNNTLTFAANSIDNGDFQLSTDAGTFRFLNGVCTNFQSHFGIQSDVNTNSFIRADTGDGNTWRITTNSVVGLETTSTLVTALVPLVIGSGGTGILRSKTFTFALTETVEAGTAEVITITATGVAAGDTFALEVPEQATGIVFVGVRGAADQIIVTFYNATGASIDLAGTLKVRSFEV